MIWYPWLQTHFKRLIAGYQIERGHHALLIKTLYGMGENVLIYAIARFLLCQHPDGCRSCGKCRSCQLMISETHPDYHKFTSEKEINGAIGIDSVRNIIEKLYKHSYLGGARVVVLQDASRLTEAASAALLKTIEEPPERTWFLLTCYEIVHLLPTLRSRCFVYHLTAPKEEWGLSWLKKKVTTSRNVTLSALRLSRGAPAEALDLLQKDRWSQRLNLCLMLGKIVKNQSWLSLLKILDHEKVSEHLYWLISLVLDSLKFQQGVTDITNLDVFSLVSNLSSTLTCTALQAIIHGLFRCRIQLLTIAGLNRKLLLTDCLLSIEYYQHPDAVFPAYSL